MANYSLVINSKFQPFSFERYLQPYQLYAQEYKEREKALEETMDKASAIGAKIDKTIDPDLWNQYNNYYNTLQEQSNQLSSRGLSAPLSSQLMQTRRNYGKQIGAIRDAITAREADAALQKEAFFKSNGRVRYSKDAATSPLASYMGGNKPEFEMVNMNDISDEATKIAAAISSRVWHTINNDEDLKNQYIIRTTEQGYSPEEAIQAISEQLPEFKQAADQIRRKFKTDKFSIADQNAFDAEIRSGFNKGLIYQQKETPLENRNFASDMDRARLELQRRGVAIEEKQAQMKQDAAGWNPKTHTFNPPANSPSDKSRSSSGGGSSKTDEYYITAPIKVKADGGTSTITSDTKIDDMYKVSGETPIQDSTLGKILTDRGYSQDDKQYDYYIEDKNDKNSDIHIIPKGHRTINEDDGQQL